MNRGADHIASARNGSSSPARRFTEPQPPKAERLIEAIVVLAGGLSAVGKCRTIVEACSLATTTLLRAGEAYGDLLRRPEVRAAMSLAATFTEERQAPQVVASEKPATAPGLSMRMSLCLPRSLLARWSSSSRISRRLYRRPCSFRSAASADI